MEKSAQLPYAQGDTMTRSESNETPETAGDPAVGKPATAADLFGDIDAYQQRLERDWESALAVYQSRLSDLMKDVPVEAPPVVPNLSPATAESLFPDGNELLARVTKTIRALDEEARVQALPPSGRWWARIARWKWAALGAAAAAAAGFLIFRTLS